MDRTVDSDKQKWRWITWCAFAAFLLLGALTIAQGPGLQYDEALLAVGAIHVLKSPGEFTLPHDPDTWFCGVGRCLPVMTVRYVGALKEYLLLPLAAVFGPEVEVLRVLSLVLALAGIAGLAYLVSSRVSPAAGAVVAWIMAIHPAYLAQNVFDHGAIAVWMGVFGLFCFALARYVRDESAGAAFWLGVTMGLGIWARANFAWLLAAVFCGALVVMGKRLFEPRRNWLAAVAGGSFGGFPFLFYQVVSRGGTWEAVGMFSAQEPVGRQLATRMVLYAEVLLSDREHRAMWEGPPIPDWQRWILPAIVLVSCAVCLAIPRWARGVAVTFLALGGMLFATRLQVSEHHLIVLVPLAAVVTVLAGASIAARGRWLRLGVGAAGVFYIVSALWWQAAAVQGLGRTGGAGVWSDAVFTLADHLLEKYPGQEVKVLDWGLQNSLYYLTGGAIASREIFGDATEHRSGLGRSWDAEIRAGGVFLLNGAGHRQFPAASNGFLRAMGEVNPQVKRTIVRQQNGQPYAELIEVTPRSD